MLGPCSSYRSSPDGLPHRNRKVTQLRNYLAGVISARFLSEFASSVRRPVRHRAIWRALLEHVFTALATRVVRPRLVEPARQWARAGRQTSGVAQHVCPKSCRRCSAHVLGRKNLPNHMHLWPLPVRAEILTGEPFASGSADAGLRSNSPRPESEHVKSPRPTWPTEAMLSPALLGLAGAHGVASGHRLVA